VVRDVFDRADARLVRGHSQLHAGLRKFLDESVT
jgi:hypothetical protein